MFSFISLILWVLFSRACVCSLQCSNSPDYTEPTQEPCVCPPGPPGLQGIKVSYQKKQKKSFFILSFSFHFMSCHFVVLQTVQQDLSLWKPSNKHILLWGSQRTVCSGFRSTLQHLMSQSSNSLIFTLCASLLRLNKRKYNLLTFFIDV